jgi:arylsulfatase A-like enzyme
VYFKNHFCTTSLCSPSRASILSGLYPHLAWSWPKARSRCV